MVEKKKLLIICPYPVDKAPSQRLKYEQYIPAFEEAGYTVDVQPFMSLKFWKIVYTKGNLLHKARYTISGYFKRFILLFSLRKYDIVYIHLWVTPFGLSLFESIYRLLSKKLIYDIDDMIFLGHSSKANKWIANLKGKGKMIYLMKSADHVITCTPTLDQLVRKFNINTTDISSTINTDIYQPKQHFKKDKIILGWSGSHSTSKYLMLLEPVFEQLLLQNANFEVLVIGDAHFEFANKSIPVSAIHWNLSSEVNDLSKIDIGLYPLPDEEWVLGKSGLKALQYMALGIPTIATKIGANYRIIRHGKNGYLVDIGDIAEWITSINLLINDNHRRQQMGEEARLTVESLYSVKSNKQKYIDILENFC